MGKRPSAKTPSFVRGKGLGKGSDDMLVGPANLTLSTCKVHIDYKLPAKSDFDAAISRPLVNRILIGIRIERMVGTSAARV